MHLDSEHIAKLFQIFKISTFIMAVIRLNNNFNIFKIYGLAYIIYFITIISLSFNYHFKGRVILFIILAIGVFHLIFTITGFLSIRS